MKKGFTLVELLAVVAIIGLLIVIVMPVYNNIAKDVRETNLESTKKIITDTMLNYANKNVIDDIKPANNNCSNGTCCKYYSISYIVNNGIFQTSNGEVINPVTNEPLEGYIKLSYNTSKHLLEAEYVDNAIAAGACEVMS